MSIQTILTKESIRELDLPLSNVDCVMGTTDCDNDTPKAQQQTTNYPSSRAQVLCFHDHTACWRELDSQCAYDDSHHHFIKGTVRNRTCFLTTELQDLSAYRLGTTTIGNYFKALCKHFCHDNIQYFDPLYTSVMVGFDSSSLIDINPLLKTDMSYVNCYYVLLYMAVISHMLQWIMSHIAYITMISITVTMTQHSSSTVRKGILSHCDVYVIC